MRCLETSVFNLMQYLLYVERIEPLSEEGQERIEYALQRGRTLGLDKQCDTSEFDIEIVMKELTKIRAAPSMTKPDGPSCYFLLHCLGASERDVQEMWKINGQIESFKGTFLHKQAELFMQSLGKQQFITGRLRVPLRTLFAEPASVAAARQAAAPNNVMRLLAAQTSPCLWDHPAIQDFLIRQVQTSTSTEYLKFEACLKSHPELTPFRTEWSIYNEEEWLAGQIDSLWLDVDKDNCLVMIDWKRAKRRLEADTVAQRNQVFQDECGLKAFAGSDTPAPCSHL